MTSSPSKNKSEPVMEPKEFVPFDPFHPVLQSGSPKIALTPQQDTYVKAILEICASDSASAKKAYHALYLVLTSGEMEAPPPTILFINPETGALDGPDQGILVAGAGFTEDSIVTVSGIPQPTGYTSPNSIAFNIVVAGSVAGIVPIAVDTLGVISNSVNFTWTAPVLLASSVPPKETPHQKEVNIFEEKKREELSKKEDKK